jgi:hypothetical protein
VTLFGSIAWRLYSSVATIKVPTLVYSFGNWLDGNFRIDEIVLPWGRWKKCWKGFLEDMWMSAKPWRKSDSDTTENCGLSLGGDANYVTPVQQFEPPETRGLMHQYNVGALFERIFIPISSLSRGPERKLIPPDGCGSLHQESEVCPIHNQEALTVADLLAPIFFFHFGIQREVQSDQGRISSYNCCCKCDDASYFPRHAQPPHIHSWTVWWNTLLRDRNNWESLFWRTGDVGMRGYPLLEGVE